MHDRGWIRVFRSTRPCRWSIVPDTSGESLTDRTLTLREEPMHEAHAVHVRHYGRVASLGRTFHRAMPVRFAALLLAAAGVACESPSEPRLEDEVLSVTVSEAPVPLVRVLEVELRSARGVQLEYWSAGEPRLRVIRPAASTRHDLVLARLRPATTYQYELSFAGDGVQGAPIAGTFTTDPLPESLAVLDFIPEGRGSHPLTLFEITRHQGGFAGVVIVDAEGEVVWYFEGPTQGAARRSNGNFVFVITGMGVLEVTPEGEVVAQLAQEAYPGRRPHHDVITTPANTLFVLTTDTREFDGRLITGDAIWEWDPGTGATTQVWSAWDHLSPATDWSAAARDDDWLHANAISLGPSGNVLISLRFMDQVVSIAPDFQSLEWRLGGLNADVVVSGDDVFFGQHTASELPPVANRRRVLIFDNGPLGRGFSRAQELELDLEQGTAHTVWEFRPDPDNFSFITSLARRLPNGNTFVAFGTGHGVVGATGPVKVFEVDETGAVEFNMEITGETVDDLFILYRAWPLMTVAGEEMVQ